jgi:predicted amidophosphoribosyltransferase
MTERPWRDDIETTTPDRQCPVCGATFTRIRRQAYCSSRCRRTAWRRRNAAPAPPAPPPAAGRKASTVYACPDCEARYLGEQWCYDCNTPCLRIGRGGLCPNCDEPVTIQQLIDTAQPPARRLDRKEGR